MTRIINVCGPRYFKGGRGGGAVGNAREGNMAQDRLIKVTIDKNRRTYVFTISNKREYMNTYHNRAACCKKYNFTTLLEGFAGGVRAAVEA